jgi:small conductance mechanosensitive channel
MQIDFSAALTKLQAMLNGLIALLPNLVLALIVFSLFYFGGRGVRAVVKSATDRYSQARALGVVLGRLAQLVVIVVGLLVSLSIVIPTFRAGDLIQLLGISGVAIGFAFRDILQNFLAGILLLLTQPFRIGDQINVLSYEGTVEDIQTRATLLRTYDGRRVVIPNASLFTESVMVNTAYARRRSEHDLTINNNTELADAKARSLAALQQVEGVLQDPPPEVLVMALGVNNTRLRARWWTAAARREMLTVQDRVITALRQALHQVEKEEPDSAAALTHSAQVAGANQH